MLAIAVLAVVGGLSACADQPYIQSPELINREHPEFAVERTDRSAFTVCYAKWETSPERVRDLAIDECRRYGKRAAFVDTTYRSCPLMAPAGATYACLGEGEALADVLSRDERRRAAIDEEIERRQEEESGGVFGSSGLSPSTPEPGQ